MSEYEWDEFDEEGSEPEVDPASRSLSAVMVFAMPASEVWEEGSPSRPVGGVVVFGDPEEVWECLRAPREDDGKISLAAPRLGDDGEVYSAVVGVDPSRVKRIEPFTWERWRAGMDEQE